MAKRRNTRLKHRKRTTKRFWLWSFAGGTIVILLWFVIVSIQGHSFMERNIARDTPTSKSNALRVVPGMPAPNIQLQTVQGETYQLSEHRGHVIVLSFLATQPDTQSTPSKSQAVFLRSMQQQYGAKGVDFVIINASESARLTDILNVVYDWNLGSIRLLVDPAKETLQHYEVQQLPTTFVLDSQSRVVQRWDGLVLPALLEQILSTALDLNKH